MIVEILLLGVLGVAGAGGGYVVSIHRKEKRAEEIARENAEAAQLEEDRKEQERLARQAADAALMEERHQEALRQAERDAHLKEEQRLETDRLKRKEVALIEEKRRADVVARMISIVEKDVKSKGIAANFDFIKYAQANDISIKAAYPDIKKLYQQYWMDAVEDGVVTYEERKFLTELAQYLRIEQPQIEECERIAKSEKYRDAVRKVLADGILTEKERVELESLRYSLEVDPEIIRSADNLAANAYFAALRKIVDSGSLDPEALKNLDRLKGAFAIRNSGLIRDLNEALLKLYRKTCAFAEADGVISAEEDELLAWLENEAQLQPELTAPYRARIERIKTLAGYRDGKLPSIAVDLILDSDELCHWRGPCANEFASGNNGKLRLEHGRLYITNKQILFLSDARRFSLLPSRVVAVEHDEISFWIEASTRTGSGTYETDDNELCQAIIEGLVKKYKRRTSEQENSSRTRSIPGHVKTEVWGRDDGRCVTCGATEYLEFDHIIPFSKGGASSIANLQILCRGCNAKKSNRIGV